MLKKRYRYRAYPTRGQGVALARTFGCVRVVFNDVIAARRAQHAQGLPFESASVLQSRLVTQAKATPARAWLGEVSATPLQQAVRDADQAYRNFFSSLSGKRKGRRVGAPRFKSRRSRQAARFTRQSRFEVRQTTHGVGKVHIPKVGWVRFALSRPLPADPSSVTVIREADGRYYVSFVVEVPAPDESAPVHPGRAAGIDLGLSDFAAITYSDGTREKITNPRHLKTQQRKLARAQRELARRQKGSANRAKSRAKVARVHRKVRETRLDFHHQLAARLVRENQAVAVEALSVVGLARSGAKSARGRGMRRSVHDAGWGTFLRVLEEKTTEHGRGFVRVNPAHSSQTCSVCGVLDGPKPLNVRTWTCQGCGSVVDRDYNAATNIMVAAGPAETLNACGPDVRLQLAGAIGDEAGTHPAAPAAA